MLAVMRLQNLTSRMKYRRHKPVRAHRMLEEACTDAVLDLGDSIPELFGDSLTFERIDRVRVCRSRHDNERDDRGLRTRLLEAEVETWSDVIERWAVVAK